MFITPQTAKSWVPPHCPNPNCRYHNGPLDRWPYKKIGFFTRQHNPRRIQRFTCLACRRSFSTQTFSQDYWQKRPDLDARIFLKIVGGMANRQGARDLGISPPTYDRHVARLARHCLLFHCVMMQSSPPVGEVVIDGFETFECSQYFPFHHNLAVEKGTDFFIYFNDSELRRKGQMTEVQKRRRQVLERTLGRPDPRAIENDMQSLLEVVLAGKRAAVVYSDDHPAYKRAIKRLAVAVDHRVTSGRKHRDKNNSLWEVNLLDLLIRHCNANHKRETIAWSKRRQASAERLLILLVWRNYVKGRREKVRGSPTPAMERGMIDKPLGIKELLERRLFRSLVPVPLRWDDYYDRSVSTRALARERHHELKLAY